VAGIQASRPVPVHAGRRSGGIRCSARRDGISIFAVSTFDTDYVLVKASQIDRAVEALAAEGHTLVTAV